MFRSLGLVVVALVVASGWLLWAGPLASQRLVLSEVQGGVELKRSDVEVSPAAEAGTQLLAADRLETSADGRAVLTLGADSHIRVGPSSTLQIVEVTATGVAVELEDGAVRATVRPESGSVRITNRGRAVLATQGEVAVGVRDDVLQVQAIEGRVALEGMALSTLASGRQVTDVGGEMDLAPIPEDLLLEVQWPPAPARTRDETGTIEGQAAPGALITMTCPGGVVETTADARGTFTAQVPLREGSNPCEILAMDALGGRRVELGTLQIRDTQGPTLRGGVHYPQ